MKSVSAGFSGWKCLHPWIFNTQTIVLSANEHWMCIASRFSTKIRHTPHTHCTYFAFKIANPLKPLQSEISINVISILSQRTNKTYPTFPVKLYIKMCVYQTWFSNNTHFWWTIFHIKYDFFCFWMKLPVCIIQIYINLEHSRLKIPNFFFFFKYIHIYFMLSQMIVWAAISYSTSKTFHTNEWIFFFVFRKPSLFLFVHLICICWKVSFLELDTKKRLHLSSNNPVVKLQMPKNWVVTIFLSVDSKTENRYLTFVKFFFTI